MNILDFIISPTYDVRLMQITDASVYDGSAITTPTLEVTPPGFNKVVLTFNPNSYNVLDSNKLGITTDCKQQLPDGIYCIKYSIFPHHENFIEKRILRVEQLLEKFDDAFLKLDIMECDGALKTQSSVQLNTINFFIQGAIAAANNCSEQEAYKLYQKADGMLDEFINSECGCGSNYFKLFVNGTM